MPEVNRFKKETDQSVQLVSDGFAPKSKERHVDTNFEATEKEVVMGDTARERTFENFHPEK